MALDLYAINQTLDAATTTLTNILDSFGKSPPSTPASFDVQASKASTVVNVGASAASDVFTNGIVSSVVGALQGSFNGVANDLSQLENGISSTINDAFSGITTAFSDIKAGITNDLSQIASSVQQGWNTVTGDLQSGFNFVVNDIQNGLQGLASGISQGLGTVVSAVGSEVSQIAGVVQQGMNAASTIIMQESASILGAVESIPKAVGTLAETILSGLGKVITTTAGDIWKNAITQEVISGLETGARDMASWLQNLVGSAITEFLPIFDEPPDATFASDLERIGAAAALEQVVGSLEEASPQVAFILSALLNKIVEAMNIGNFRDLEHIGNWQYPNRDVDVGNLITARYRGVITQDAYYEELRKQGISQKNADIIYVNAMSMMQVNELVSLYYRGVLSDKQQLYKEAGMVNVPQGYVDRVITLFEQLITPNTAIELWRRKVLPEGWQDYFDDARRAGWTQERINALKDISYVIPNPQTLKQFILHHADDDAFAAKYGLDTGINQEYIDKAAMLGYTEADAKRIYRTEWAFPQLFILRTMYAAGEVSEQDFKTILAATGMAPYFVDALATSLAPKLTLADIKDLYKYQVITADDIITRLEAIGISGSLASQYKTLWEASVKLAAPVDQTAAQTKAATVKGLSETIIKENYIDGAITKDEATRYLKEIGYAPEEIALNMNVWDITMKKATVAQTIAAIKEEAKARTISLNDAIIAIQQLDLSPAQVAQYTTEIEQYMMAKTKTPTLAEVTKWFKDSLLTPQEYMNALSMLGYAQQWMAYFLVAAGMTQQEVSQLGLTFGAFTG